MIGERGRTIKLQCPRLSNIVQLVASEEQRVDLGCISGAFGLDPSTLKLNGHFISRGVDLIASSVTWKSLLSFFSARGLSTGATDSDALLVDGKLSKVGTKRAHDPTYIENGIPGTSEFRNNCVNRRLRLEDFNLLNKRFRDRNSVSDDDAAETTKCKSFSLHGKQCLEDIKPSKRTKTVSDDDAAETAKCKRFSLKGKQYLEGVKPSKRIKANGTESTDLGFQGSESGPFGTISKTHLPCSFIGKNMKRMRDDEMIVTSPCKKMR